MDKEQLTEFRGILEENGWTKLTPKELAALKRMMHDAIRRKEEVIEFKGKEMLRDFASHLLAHYNEYGI